MAKEQLRSEHGWLRVETCCRCKTPFAMSEETYLLAQERRDGFTFYCPHGHGQVYTKGETEADKLRRERDQVVQRLAQRDDRIRELNAQVEMAGRRVSAAKGQITKLKNRARAGLCPCCNRSFVNLARHMGTKHPGFVSEPDSTETVTVN